MDKAELSHPVEVKVLSRRDNGSGVVEIPLLPATEIDLAHTAGGGKGKTKITEGDLAEMVTNFEVFPGPVPIGVSPHVEFGDRGGFAPGFVNALKVRAGVLFGELDLIAPLLAEIESGGWRGFSVEIAKNLKTATVALVGWALTGGIFTNRPATDVNFRIAASDDSESEQQASFSICLTAGEQEIDTMSEEKIASLEAEIATKDETIKGLRSKEEGSKGDAVSLEARLTESNKDLAAVRLEVADTKAKLGASEVELERVSKELVKSEQTRKEAEIKLEAEENRTLRENAVTLAHKAIDRGVSAKHFEGMDEDPSAWFRKRFVSLEAMGQFIDALPTVSESSVQSGNKPDGTEHTMSKENAAKLERMGLNPKFAGKTSENEILALRAADKE